MSRPEQTAALVAAAARRHDDARRRAVAALRRLDGSGAPVNMSTVARAAGVSRAWLYRQADLRAIIDTLRQPRPQSGRVSRPRAERATDDSLRHQLEALRALHVELEAENRRLHEALVRKLGQQRTAATADFRSVDVHDMSTTSNRLQDNVVDTGGYR